MKRVLRIAIACLMTALLAAPAPAQTDAPAATKGESVIVSLQDGRSITGVIGDWTDQIGFQVIPSGGVAYFIRPAEIATIRSAATGAPRGLPLRESKHRMSVQAKFMIGAAIAIGVPLVIAVIRCSPKGCD